MNNWDENLPLETEKYLCKLHRLNAYDLLKLEKQKEVELGLADANENYDLSFDIIRIKCVVIIRCFCMCISYSCIKSEFKKWRLGEETCFIDGLLEDFFMQAYSLEVQTQNFQNSRRFDSAYFHSS